METHTRLAGLDGLRGIAALAVLLYHFDFTSGHLAAYGALGVELFFVISGFVMLMTLEKLGSVREFAIGRMARLYPAYLASVLITGVVLLAFPEYPRYAPDLGSVLVNATMLQKFVGVRDIIDPYWTLAFELWFYVVIAALFALKRTDRIDLIALVWIGGLFACRAAALNGSDGGLYHSALFQLLYVPQFGHLFIAGLMIYRITTSRGTLTTLLALGGAALCAVSGRPDWTQIPPLTYLIANVLLIATVWAAACNRLPLLGWRPFVWLGACSYSLYLFHMPVFLITKRALAPFGFSGWTVAAVAVVASLAVAALGRRFLEQPAIRWARNLRAAQEKALSLGKAGFPLPLRSAQVQ